MGLSGLVYAYSAVDAGQDEGFTVFADLAFVLWGEFDFCGHGYFSCCVYVVLGEDWVLFVDLFCEGEERFDALGCYALGVAVHGLGSAPLNKQCLFVAN